MAPWIWFACITLITWGLVGLLQKLCTNCISAESSLIWLVAGFVLLEPLLYRSSLSTYSRRSLIWAILGGTLNALGSWALFKALKSGGKAAVVAPVTALYPLIVVALAPVLLRESITKFQSLGVLCALVAVVLLSS